MGMMLVSPSEQTRRRIECNHPGPVCVHVDGCSARGRANSMSSQHGVSLTRDLFGILPVLA